MLQNKSLTYAIVIVACLTLSSCATGTAGKTEGAATTASMSEQAIPEYPGRRYIAVGDVYFNVLQDWELQADGEVDWEGTDEVTCFLLGENDSAATVTVAQKERDINGNYHVQTIDDVTVFSSSYDIGGFVSFNYKGRWYSFHIIGMRDNKAASEIDTIASTVVFL